MADVQKTIPRYQVDADTSRVIQPPIPSSRHQWPSDRDFMDYPEGEVLLFAQGLR